MEKFGIGFVIKSLGNLHVAHKNLTMFCDNLLVNFKKELPWVIQTGRLQ